MVFFRDFLLIVLILTWSTALSAAKSRTVPLRLFLDPGHGGVDAGASGPDGISEKTVCLKLSHYVEQSVIEQARHRRLPVNILLSREEDRFVSLRDRVRLANEWKADLFISLHANSSPVARARGFEVYFMNAQASDEQAHQVAKMENQVEKTQKRSDVTSDIAAILNDVQLNQHIMESQEFAGFMYGALARFLFPNVRGVRQAPFAVLSGTQMSAILIEVGYLTNTVDAKNLGNKNYLKLIADAISTGVIEFQQRKKRKLG